MQARSCGRFRTCSAILPRGDILLDVASTLGSDVPYFLVGGTAVAAGRGVPM